LATYPLTDKENSRRIRVSIRHVFLEVWDPIGVRDSPDAQDEYDSYIGRAFDLLGSEATDAELGSYLDSIVENMGMDGSRRPYANVIQALRAIDLNRSPGRL
jgi:hypothetical protein